MDRSMLFESPPPLVNTKYELVGGMDTPTAAIAARIEADENDYSDVGFRRGLGDDKIQTSVPDHDK
jgi:hypothetical protein